MAFCEEVCSGSPNVVGHYTHIIPMMVGIAKQCKNQQGLLFVLSIQFLWLVCAIMLTQHQLEIGTTHCCVNCS
jgi:hypothetical protein